MAYDLLWGMWVPMNIALSSSLEPSIDVSTREATPTSDADKAYIAQLAVLKMNADAGSKKAKKEWQKALANLLQVQKKAKKGDLRSAHLLTVVRESGLFSDVKAMDITGAMVDPSILTPRAKGLLATLSQVKAKALRGDSRAMNLVSAINSLHFETVVPPSTLGEDEDIEELKLRAEAGDKRAQKRLEILIKDKITKSSGDDDQIANRQVARKMLEDAADAKTIKRADVKKAIALYAGSSATDKEKTDIGSKILTFLQKKNVQITS